MTVANPIPRRNNSFVIENKPFVHGPFAVQNGTGYEIAEN
jgi:hypothetical protein